MTVCELDFRAGGSWRFVLQSPDGKEHPFCGEIREVVPPERVVQTFVYDVEGLRDFPTVETMTLVEEDGKTLMTVHGRYVSQQARDGHYSSGMEEGAAETYARLDELLAALG